MTINNSTITKETNIGAESVIRNRSEVQDDIDEKRVSKDIPILIINNSTIENNMESEAIYNDRASLTINYSSIKNASGTKIGLIETTSGDVTAFEENNDEPIIQYVRGDVTINSNQEISDEMAKNMVKNNGESDVTINNKVYSK